MQPEPEPALVLVAGIGGKVPNDVAIKPQPVSAQPQTIVTSHKAVVEALIKYHNIHEGIWGIFVRFGIGAMNAGENEQQLLPAAIVPLMEIGLQKFEKETNISVDADKVNPKPQPPAWPPQAAIKQ
jgi:hypothetical protein